MNAHIAWLKNRFLTISVLSALVAAGCGGTQDNQNVGTSQSAALTGRVDSTVQQSAGGNVHVTASRINDDGSLTVVSSAAASVGGDGRYNLVLADGANGSSTAGGGTQLVVNAVGSGGQVVGRSMVEGSFVAASTARVVAPMTRESTAAADLLLAARATGQWSPSYSLGALRALLSDEVAVAIPTVALAAMASWNAMLTAEGVTLDEQKMALAAVSGAEATLDAQLDAATTADQISAAESADLMSFITAYSAVGATAQDLASAATAMVDTTTAFAATLSADAGGRTIARVNYVESLLVTAALNAEFQAMGAAQGAQQAVAVAGTTLQSQISASAQAGATAQAQIQHAWQQYSAQITIQLEALLNSNASLFDTLQVSIAAALHTLDTVRTTLASQASASAAASVEAQALLQYMSRGVGLKDKLVAVGWSDAHASAWLNIALTVSAAGALIGQ